MSLKSVENFVHVELTNSNGYNGWYSEAASVTAKTQQYVVIMENDKIVIKRPVGVTVLIEKLEE